MKNVLLIIFCITILSAEITFGQTPTPTPAEKDCATELKETKEKLTRSEASLKDWAQLNRYRQDNSKVPTVEKNEERVVFMGDSITDYWSQPNRSGVKFFPNKPYLNRGIRGQMTGQMLIRFYADVIALKPRAVIILAGTNDLPRLVDKNSLLEIQYNLAAMCNLAQLNKIRVILSSVLPVSDYGKDATGKPLTVTSGRPPEKIVALNKWIKSYSAINNFVYLDYFSQMVDKDGFLKKELSDDGLHPNAKGYEVMTPLAEAAIKTALGSQTQPNSALPNPTPEPKPDKTSTTKNYSEIALLNKMPSDILTKIGRGGKPDKDGLVGHNKGNWYEAGLQRGAMQYLLVAAAQNNAEDAEDAWRAIDATFETKDLPDGKRSHTYGDKVGTVAFWLQELSHALLVVKDSKLEPRFRERTNALMPKIRKAYSYMSEGAKILEQKDSKATNRLLISAKAFGLGGTLLNDDGLKSLGKHFVDISLERQNTDGVFLEDGGADTSYHAVSLLMLQIYAAYQTDSRIDAAIKNGMAWELARIKPTGEVEVNGNTRTGLGQEMYFGKAKKVNTTEVILALFYYGSRFDEKQVLKTGEKVFDYGQENR
jgi:lysophospholipase L1-like esterase